MLYRPFEPGLGKAARQRVDVLVSLGFRIGREHQQVSNSSREPKCMWRKRSRLSERGPTKWPHLR